MSIDEIRANVTIEKLLEYYGFELNRAGFMSCPFHSDNHPSLKVYSSTNTWYCFSCHWGGDIFTFVELYEKVDFVNAVKKIQEYFNLNSDEGFSFTPSHKRITDKDITDLKFKKLLASRNYWQAIKEKEEPVYDSSIVNFNELYATACKKLPIIEAKLDEIIESSRTKF